MPSDLNDNNDPNFLGISIQDVGRAVGGVSKCVKVAAAGYDVYKIGDAVYTDCTTTSNGPPGKRTIKASASVAGGWTGSSVGAYIGTGVGTLFGGVGAVPGAVIGGTIGSFTGSFTAKRLADWLL
jgi:hypothetical protein